MYLDNLNSALREKIAMRSDAGKSRLLKYFESRRNEWVGLPSILRLGIAQYNARIKELRGDGHLIENRTEYIQGVRNSWFRYGGMR